jgi:3,4-dihydroxy 2-butanone 4-phosphate synthase/GTP cyclohydrolase II
MVKISEEGSGAAVFISRPDRGFSQLDEVKSATESTGLRDYGIGAQILVALGLEKIRLLSNTSRNVVGLDGFGLEIVEQVKL